MQFMLFVETRGCAYRQTQLSQRRHVRLWTRRWYDLCVCHFVVEFVVAGRLRLCMVQVQLHFLAMLNLSLFHYSEDSEEFFLLALRVV
jgi:hypothetical protein